MDLNDAGVRIRCGALLLCILLAPAARLAAQSPAPQAASAPTLAGTPLEDLLKEAEANNPAIRAAQQAWDGTKLAATQVSEPPFQPLARAEADLAQQNYEVVRRAVRADVKAAYFELAYVVQTLQTLETEGQLLRRLEQASEARYRAGQGNQQEVLRGQLEETKYLAEISHHDLDAAKIQYRLKELLNRSPSFSDVTPVTISETTLESTYYDLWAAARGQNPEIAAADRAVETQRLRTDLARRGVYPFFDMQYDRQRMDPTHIRASYLLALSARPSSDREADHGPAVQSAAQPGVAQAEAELLRVRSESESQSLEIAEELGAQYSTAQRTKDALRTYREGILPQAAALVESGLAAYQNNRLDFADVLSASLESSRLNSEYWQILAEHEIAIARIEEMTGTTIRPPAQRSSAVTP